ncbi:unnamed protein product, partial [Boreogadus saida]
AVQVDGVTCWLMVTAGPVLQSDKGGNQIITKQMDVPVMGLEGNIMRGSVLLSEGPCKRGL